MRPVIACVEDLYDPVVLIGLVLERSLLHRLLLAWLAAIGEMDANTHREGLLVGFRPIE